MQKNRPLLFAKTYTILSKPIFYNSISCFQHILYKNPISPRGVIYQYMRHRTHYLPILEYRTSTHECVNIGPTSFGGNFICLCRKNRLNKPFLSHAIFFNIKTVKLLNNRRTKNRRVCDNRTNTLLSLKDR